MSDLIARLETVAAQGAAGDWPDVVARSERQRSATLRRRLLVAVAVAVLAVPTIAVATHYWDVLSLSATEEEVPLPQGENTLGYVIGDRVRLPGRQPTKLAAPLLAPYGPPHTQLAVPSPDRRKVVYQTWEGNLSPRRGPRRGVPILRLFDGETGRDTLLARGAHSPAWRGDGVFASVRARISDTGRSIAMGRGHLVVSAEPGRPAVRWSATPSRWSNLMWAGRYLLARGTRERPYKWGGNIVTYHVHAFSGPGRGRTLPLSGLIAVSPDGRLVLGRYSLSDGMGSDTDMRVVDVATGRIVDRMVGWSGPGTWSGETILMTTGWVSEPIGPGPGGVELLPGPDFVRVVVLRYSDGKLEPERELRLSRDVVEATGIQAENFDFSFDTPAFVDKAGRQFTTKLAIHNTDRKGKITNVLVFLTCDRIELRCRRGRSLDPWQIRWSSLVSNPSRPLPD
jgi:hypothetical protein